MPGRTSQVNKSFAISKALEVRAHSDAIRSQVRRIAESAEFRGSERSREFLVVIVEKALAGRFDELKERVLGVELFGRTSSYDTAEDAIVRVTACDVRRRLIRYYGATGKDSDLRIAIPAGSYIPEFLWAEPAPAIEESGSLTELETTFHDATPDSPGLLPTELAPEKRPTLRLQWVAGGVVLGIVLLVGAGRMWNRGTPESAPWSSLLQKGHRLSIIVSDTEITKMQNLGGYNLSLSDYANHRYLPAGFATSPEMTRVLSTFRGQSMAASDVSLALAISQRAFAASGPISVLPARSVQLKDFRTDENFVILGSPRSDPWVALFEDQLDFQFVFDAANSRELVRNRRPQKSEQSTYMPSARGWDTGQAFGIIAFLANPDQSGHALLLAGSNAEATEAAGKFALNREMMADLLKSNGISPNGNPVPFEVLLRVNTMAGSPNTFDVVAFHRL